MVEIHKEELVYLNVTGSEIELTMQEAHALHDQLTVFINNNPLPDDEE